jgi:hypothetical protein
MKVALLGCMTLDLEVLHCGNCEELKAGVHATALGLFVVMGVYNVAAWLSRRESHLAVNALVYLSLTAFERRHVAHHLAEIRKPHLVVSTEDIDASVAPDLAA